MKIRKILYFNATPFVNRWILLSPFVYINEASYFFNTFFQAQGKEPVLFAYPIHYTQGTSDHQ